MRIGYVTYYDPADVHSWSGLGHKMAQSLEKQGAVIVPFGPLHHQRAPINVARYFFHRYVRHRNDHPHRDPGFLAHYARQVEAKLAQHEVDVLLGPGLLPLVHVQTELPVAVWTDCTFATLLNYYAKFSDLSQRTVRNGHAADQKGLQRCDAVIMSCQWAIDSAVNDYGVEPSRCHLIPFGSNLSVEPGADEVEAAVVARSEATCRLLFVSVDWERKGGDVALGVARELDRRGISVELVVVGCEPPLDSSELPGWIRREGFVSKRTPEGAARLASLFREAHFLLLPTRADCTPVVLSEAASFGLPSIATITGGLPSIVQRNVNGCLFPLDAPAEEYADWIEPLMRNPEAYRELARTTRREYERRLNWNIAGVHAMEALKQIVCSAPLQSAAYHVMHT